MKKLVLLLLPLLLMCDRATPPEPVEHLVGDSELAQVAGVRYVDLVFTATTKISNVTYDAGNGLKLDLYFPSPDTATKRWLVVFAHGGGFTSGDKADSKNVTWAKDMAKRGYVAASINYRLKGLLVGEQYGGADMCAAIRFLRSKSALYKLDTARVVTFGGSAGGSSALACAYWQEIRSLNTSNAGFNSAPNLCGESAGYLQNAASVMQAGEPPLFMTHCKNDSTVPFALALSTFNAAGVAGLDTTSFWQSGGCSHALIGCCLSATNKALASWIYSRF